MRSTDFPIPRISRRGLLLLAAAPAILSAATAAASEPRPSPPSPRDRTARHSLDGVWKFRTDPYADGEDRTWFAPSFDASAWEDMTVPGVWDVINEHSEYAGAAWYRTGFATDPGWSGKLVRLVFEAAYNDATVWLNGRLLGTNDNGFLPFHFDLRNLAPPGQRNQLTVRVDNRRRLGAVWNWGGIRRPVWLEITDPTRIERVKITAEPDLQTGRARVIVRAQALSHDGPAADISAQVTLRRDGVVIWTSPVLAGTRDFVFETVLEPAQVHLWHLNSPQLYEAEVSLMRGGATIHSQASRFGIRKVEIAGERLLLNGEPIRPVGFNLVPEDRRTGSVLPPSRYRADIDLMKMLGTTMARLSHFPLPPEVLDYLDEVGILSISELPIWGKSELVDARSKVAADWLERLIDTQFNHPSIIGWSVGNEIGRYDRNPGAREYVRTAIARAKALDPSRFAVYATNTAGSQKDDPIAFADLITMNAYGDLAGAVEKTRALHPGKPIFLSEYGGGGELDSEDPNEAKDTGDAFLNQLRGKPYVIGGSRWTLTDYRSDWAGWPFSPATGPSQNRSWGILTSDRRPKRSYFSYRAAHAPVAKMALQRRGADWSITLAPRGTDDLPAYAMRGYRILWRVLDAAGDPIDAGLIEVPSLDPGATPVTLRVPAKRAGATILADLIDPLGYSVLTVKNDLAPPAAPVIRHVHASSKTARIMFDPVARADGYRLAYDGPGGPKQAAPTINDFVDVAGLELDQRYTFRLVAFNEAGESAPSAAVSAMTTRDDLPPILWSIQSADQAVFVNYSTEATDYLYEIELTLPGSERVRRISVTTRGATRIPGLENGKTYRLRIRRRNGIGFDSGWSEPRSATPRGPGDLPAPASGCLVPGPGDLTLLVFDPVPDAASYEVRFGGRTVSIRSAASGTGFLRGIGRAQAVSLRAIDDLGQPGQALELRRLH